MTPSRRTTRIALVLLGLLALAALACRISISTAHFADPRLYKDPNGDTSTRSYGPDDTLTCRTTLKDADAGTGIRAEWQRALVDEQDGATDGATITGYETVAETDLISGGGLLVFEAAPPDADGWPKGPYRLRLYLDGDHKETLEFSVK